MKVVVAMDSFKGSLTSMEAGYAAGEGILAALPDAEVVVRPLADGGEGTMEVLAEDLGGESVQVKVSDPLGRTIMAQYVILPDGKTAVMEMAQAAGLTLLAEEERNPYKTTTYGVGEMIRDAIAKGCRDFIIGIGGSATNDGGIGMLTALGFCFYDEKGKELQSGAESLGKVIKISAEEMLPQVSECSFRIACDVENPLCGENGATRIYAPQKGLDLKDCVAVDKTMEAYADVAEQFSGRSCRDIPGAGAAGGMGFAFVNFLGASLVRGAELVLQVTELEKYLADADIFITGEGRMDGQTAKGKAPVIAARRATSYKCKVYAFAGKVTEEAKISLAEEIDEMYAITPEEMQMDSAMEKDTAKRNMKIKVNEVFARFT